MYSTATLWIFVPFTVFHAISGIFLCDMGPVLMICSCVWKYFFQETVFFFFFFKSHWDYGIKLVENHLKHILRLFWRFFKISSYEHFCVQNSVYFLYKNWTLSLPYDLTSKAIALQLVSCDSEWSKVVYSVDFFFFDFQGGLLGREGGSGSVYVGEKVLLLS